MPNHNSTPPAVITEQPYIPQLIRQFEDEGIIPVGWGVWLGLAGLRD